MSILINLLFRPWFYVVAVVVSVLFMDPVSLRYFPLFLGTMIYMGAIWILCALRKSRLYECKSKNIALVYGLLMLAPPALYVSGAYGSAFMTAYLLVVAGLLFPVPQIDAYKYIEADAERLAFRRQGQNGDGNGD